MMTSMPRYAVFLLMGLLFLSLSAPLLAAEKQDKAAKRAALLMQKMKQDFETEKAALQAQYEQEKQALNASLEESTQTVKRLEVKTVTQAKQLKQLQAEQQALLQEKQTLSSQVQQQQAQIEQQQQQLENAEQHLRQTKATLEVNEQQRRVLLSKVNQSHQQVQSCEDKNQRLYATGLELIQLQENATALQKVFRAEPVLQLKRVELENIVQGKHTTLLENKLDTNATPH